jgi:hypothetical protein
MARWRRLRVTPWLLDALLSLVWAGCGSSAAPGSAAPPGPDANDLADVPVRTDGGQGPRDGAALPDDAGTPDADAPDAGTTPHTQLVPAPFRARTQPVLEGQFAVPALPFLPSFPFSGDACVLRAADGLRMYHTCYATDRSGTDTCLATSSDGEQWTLVDTGDPDSLGRVLRSPVDAWDAAHETPYALVRDGQTYLYAVGYAPPSAGFLGASSVRLGLARSPDGVRFGPVEGPLFEPEPGALDDHGLTSPSVLPYEDGLALVYTGFCLDAGRCPRAVEGKYTAQLGARSSDGVTWQREAEPVLVETDLPWAPDGVAETHVVRDPDSGLYLMFFQALRNDAPHVLGLGWAESPFGPYHLHPSPILVPEDVGAFASNGIVAPHALFEPDEVLLYFSGEERDPSTGATKTFRVGLARAPRPLLRAP